MERLTKARYPNGVASRGHALNEVVVKRLRGIESELDSRARVAKLKSFISLTRDDGGNRSRSLRLKQGGFNFRSGSFCELGIPTRRVGRSSRPRGTS